MKKTLALLLTVIALCSALSVHCARTINTMSRDVSYTAVNERGDRKLLEGIKIRTLIGAEWVLLWENTFEPFSSDISTDVSYIKTGLKYEAPKEFWGLSCMYYDKYSFRYEIPEYNDMLTEAENKLQDSYGEITVSCKLKDYYDYYPLFVQLELPDFSMQISMKSFEEYNSFYHHPDFPLDRADGFYEKLSDFIKIPVEENEEISITVENSQYGISYSSDNIDNYCPEITNAVFDDRLYFSVSNVYEYEPGLYKLVDMSQIPGGNGIYTVAFSENDVFYEDMKNAFPLPDNCTVKGLYADKVNARLYVMLLENGKYLLKVLDERTMTEISQIELTDLYYSDWMSFSFEGDFAVFVKNDLEIITVLIDEKGKLSKAQHYRFETENEYEWYNYPYDADFAYTDGRLIVCIPDKAEFNNALGLYSGCGFDLFIFGSDDIEYYARYVCSLSEYARYKMSFTQSINEKVSIELQNAAE